MRFRRVRLRRPVAAALSALLFSAGLTAMEIAPASAVIADQPVSAIASSMWQTNNTVWALAVSNGVVYAGGDFTRVRPPGAPLGTSETTRNRLAAFDASTGALITTFNPNVNGRILDLAASPDGTKLYVVGAFTTVSGQPRAARRPAAPAERHARHHLDRGRGLHGRNRHGHRYRGLRRWRLPAHQGVLAHSARAAQRDDRQRQQHVQCVLRRADLRERAGSGRQPPPGRRRERHDRRPGPGRDRVARPDDRLAARLGRRRCRAQGLSWRRV